MTDKLQEMLKIPTTQYIAKNRMDSPMHEQSISNPSTEAITQRTIQNINRDIPFCPYLIYRLPSKLKKKFMLAKNRK